MNYSDLITLNNGVKIPRLGFGIWMIEDLQLCEDCVLSAIDAGYRLIDGAAVYLNEQALGAALRKTATPRQDLFITTKVWIQDLGYEQTKKAFEKSLARLQLDYLDMYLIHWPFGDYQGSWKAMEELYKAGKVKAIGVSNFPEYQLRSLLANSETKPVINQVECHPYFQQKELRAYMDKNGIVLQSYSPLGHGASDLLKDGELNRLAQKYGKTAAQIVLRWHVQEGFSAIPKSAHPSRIEENFKVFDFTISPEDMAAIRNLDRCQKVTGSPNDPIWEKKLSRFKVDI
jgi:diketogulonate reductase-like aldo/keto reductase